jgi:hypothetical protein
MKRLRCALVLTLLTSGGCATFGPQPGGIGTTRGVFHGRWWNYYERGSSFLAGDMHEHAVADFQEALRGRGTDTWRARTYGLHFVEYFPNRELGIAYFHQGRFDEAEQSLTRALSHVDTARAHDYLDRIQEARIARGDIRDAAPPEIHTNLHANMLTADRLVALEISAADDTGVRAVTLNGAPLHQRGSTREVALAQSLLLDEGENLVVIAATDLAGKTTTASIPVHVDLTGPTIGVIAPLEGAVIATPSVDLRLAAVDRAGIAEVTVNGVPMAGVAGAERVESGGRYPLQPGENRFQITARDGAGNETATVLAVFHGDAGSAAVQEWRLQRQPPIRLAHGGVLVLTEMLAQPDTGPPAISMKSPKADAVYRHNRTLRVYGKVVSDTAITGVAVNGEPYAVAGTPNETFERRIPLDEAAFQEGDANYTIAIHAEDAAGKASDLAYDVVVRPAVLNTPESKMPVAVLAFENPAAPALAHDVRAKTESALFNTARFNLLERQRLLDILTEQQLSDALARQDAALQIGKIIPAHVFFIGDVIERGQEVEVLVRAISTETGEIIGAVDAHIRDKSSLESLDRGATDLAQQLAAYFPRLSGQVVSIQGKDVYVDWTADDGIQPRMHLLVVDDVPAVVDEDGFVEVEGRTEPVGEAQIREVLKTNSRANTIRVEEGTSVEEWRGKAAVSM